MKNYQYSENNLNSNNFYYSIKFVTHTYYLKGISEIIT